MLIDDRDGSRELVFVHPLDEMGVLCRLTCDGCAKHAGPQAIGDVSIVGNGPSGSIVSIGVEAKSVTDLIDAERTGRLGDQIKAIIDHYDVRWLLTYGQYRATKWNGLEVFRSGRWRKETQGGRDVPFGYLESALLTIDQAGVSHKHVHDEEQAAAWLGCLERWWSKPWDQHKLFHRFNRASAPGLIPELTPYMSARMEVAACLPGIGWEKATAAACSFKSVREMINADISQWQDVPGIGKGIARAVVQHVSMEEEL